MLLAPFFDDQVIQWGESVFIQGGIAFYDMGHRDYAVTGLFNEIKGARKFSDISVTMLTPPYIRKSLLD